MPETFAEWAVRSAAEPATIKDRLLFTGRVLVKQAFEHVEVPDMEHTLDILQYAGPEIRLIADPLFRFAAAGHDKAKDTRQALYVRRLVYLNKVARDKSEAISIYDRRGKLPQK